MKAAETEPKPLPLLKPEYRSKVLFWLGSVCFLIVMMVVVGGVTRLTGSGLSITEWKPIMGAVPPLSETEWQEAFYKYQQYPQFKIMNSEMTLSGFKFIFFWEYFHRLLGRALGLVFLLPWLFFVANKVFSKNLGVKLFWGFVLGGSQGALGWFMVKSGLVDMPRVSHFRLAAHLSLALIVLSYLFWIFLGLLSRKGQSTTDNGAQSESHRLQKPLILVSVLLCLQIIYGAFVAGLKAGFAFNTFPLMNGEFIPSSFIVDEFGLMSVFQNGASVQFIHRMLAYFLVATIAVVFFKSKKMNLSRNLQKAMHALFGMVCVQFLLGVLALLFVVPVSLGAIHQLGACVLLLIALWANFEARVRSI